MQNQEILQQFAPTAQYHSSASVTTHASPEAVMRALQRVALVDMPLSLWLGRSRYVSARLRGKAPEEGDLRQPFIKHLTGSGTLVLARTPKMLVTDAAGQYHQITNQEFKRLPSPEAFLPFNHPDSQKLYISIHIERVQPDLTRLPLEHWTNALSDSSRRRFALNWLIIKPIGNFVSHLLLRATAHRANPAEQGRVMSLHLRRSS